MPAASGSFAPTPARPPGCHSLRSPPPTVEALERIVPAEASSANPVDLLGSATATTYEAALPIVLADPGVDAVIVLFVPPVVATTADVAAAIARASAGAEKPVVPVVISADGSPRRQLHLSRVRRPGARARRAARGVAAAPCGEASASRPHRPGRGRRARRPRARGHGRRRGSSRRDLRALLARLRPAARRRARRRRRRRCRDRRRRDRLPRRRQDGGRRSAQDRDRRRRISTCGTKPRCGAPCEAVNGPVLVQQYVTGGAELLAGVDPGSRVRAARRLRPRRRLRRVDRVDAVRARTPRRDRRRGADLERQGGEARGRLARRPAGRPRLPSPI